MIFIVSLVVECYFNISSYPFMLIGGAAIFNLRSAYTAILCGCIVHIDHHSYLSLSHVGSSLSLQYLLCILLHLNGLMTVFWYFLKLFFCSFTVTPSYQTFRWHICSICQANLAENFVLSLKKSKMKTQNWICRIFCKQIVFHNTPSFTW